MRKALVVGGSFGAAGGRESGVVTKLAAALDAGAINGGSLDAFRSISIAGFGLVIWMPNVSNDVDKVYPRKDKGAVLVCSKVMRPGYTHWDSGIRIFRMNANAVIEVHPQEDGLVRFVLLDALNNEWVDTTRIDSLAARLLRLETWTRDSIRVASVPCLETCPEQPEVLSDLVKATKIIADKVEHAQGPRYFGNASTRCMKMFPSARGEVGAFVSPRNVDKKRIEAQDFVFVALQEDGTVGYHGERKPSVDSAVQLKLYEARPAINFMVHGHAYVRGAPYTENYFPCGDLREEAEIGICVPNGTVRAVLNLRNHGFLMMASTVEDLNVLVERAFFESRLPKESRPRRVEL